MTTSRDGCVVPTGPLASLLSTFVDNWLDQRPPTKGQRGRAVARLQPVGPYDFLAQETGLPIPQIKRVRNRTSARTELRVADALIGVIGEPGMFVSIQGEPPLLPIEPNPRAKPSAQIECCGRTVAAFNGSASPR